MKHSGRLAAQTIADASRAPKALHAGFASDVFALVSPFRLLIGSSEVVGVRTVVETQEGEEWFSIGPANEPGAPIQLSASFYDSAGRPTLKIRGNECTIVSASWDVAVEGSLIVVRQGERDHALQLRLMPPHTLRLERLRMISDGLGVEVDAHGEVCITRDGVRTCIEDCVVRSSGAVFLV